MKQGKGEEMEYLRSAAERVVQEIVENPDIGISVDPDVAEFMGAFESDENLADVIAGKEVPDY